MERETEGCSEASEGLYTSLKMGRSWTWNLAGATITPSHVRTLSITGICHAALAAGMMLLHR